QDIVCAYSTSGLAGLPGNTFNVSMAAGTQKLPQIAASNGIFHLVYADPAEGMTYRQGTPATPVKTVEVDRPEIKIFPNPVEDHVSIVTDLVLERVELYAATGKLVLQVQAPSGPILLPELPDGLYWLRIVGDEAQRTDVKLIMKK
ncbi:MAG: T9SS type A sorting domain-containing protein, partial [Saprospiraceae bacterium]|nr:T9SS type A sorting domain-containing protein [Saprospiraceae bacterium]